MVVGGSQMLKPKQNRKAACVCLYFVKVLFVFFFLLEASILALYR